MKSKQLLVPRYGIVVLAALFPFITAAEDDSKGCGADDEEAAQITPDVTGDWDLTWENNLDVTITIGGAVYEESFGAEGGLMTIDHDGTPITFDLDCSRELVVCPSEVWPSSVALNQRDEVFPRNVYVTIPISECNGQTTATDPEDCGPEAETCEVCEGEVTQSEAETFGRITMDNENLVVLLGGTVASNGVNCALLGLSIAETEIETTGSAANHDWEAVALPNGEVITGYAGGCLWGGDVNDDGTIEAIAVGAAVELRTAFSGVRQ